MDRTLPSTVELIHEMRRLTRKMEEAADALRNQAREAAEAEGKYKKEYAKAYLVAEGPVAERNAKAEVATNQLRIEASIASGLARAGFKLVDALDTQISATQSTARAIRAEAELARTGPGA